VKSKFCHSCFEKVYGDCVEMELCDYWTPSDGNCHTVKSNIECGYRSICRRCIPTDPTSYRKIGTKKD
jgi:hypothetical protein